MNTVVLQGLDPLTEYSVNVYSVVGEDSSEPLSGTETTRKSQTSFPPQMAFGKNRAKASAKGFILIFKNGSMTNLNSNYCNILNLLRLSFLGYSLKLELLLRLWL